MQIGPLLKAYADYAVAHFERARAVAALRARAAKSRSAAKLLAELEGLHGQSLDSLLIVPIQRLCRYPILIRHAAALISAVPPESRLLPTSPTADP